MRAMLTAPGRLRAAALAALAVALLAAALAGAFAPAAAAAPDAAQIDAFLAQNGSPMTGAGATFAAAGTAYGVDPAFLVAVAGAETSFGRQLYAENGDQCTYNAFNWFYGPTWPSSDFASWDDAIVRVASGIAGDLYYGSGLYSVDAIAPKYCPDGTAEWVANVKTFMAELGGNPGDSRLGASDVAPPAGPTPAPSGPGLVALDGAVKFDQGDREVGQRIYAWFTLTNSGGQPVRLQGIRLAVRGPGGVRRDLVSDQALTLAPGQTTEVSTAWALDLAGRWRGWIEVTQGGTTTRVGGDQAFAFWVRLSKHLEMRRWELRDSTLSQAL